MIIVMNAFFLFLISLPMSMPASQFLLFFSFARVQILLLFRAIDCIAATAEVREKERRNGHINDSYAAGGPARARFHLSFSHIKSSSLLLLCTRSYNCVMCVGLSYKVERECISQSKE